jgi:hypothetical protein
MREYEKEVFEEFKQYANVVETWSLYDSIVICPTLYGTEQNASWFTTFAGFSTRETHRFYKTRTEATVGPQYNNQQSSDSMDFAFKIHSIGLAIMGPPFFECQPSEVDSDAIVTVDAYLPQWFVAEFPYHCGIQLKVQQDIRVELPVVACPPGYGAIGGGVSSETPAIITHGDIPYVTNQSGSGVPVLSNRYPLPEPIGVPRTGQIEGILHVSEWARNTLANVTGPHQIVFNSDDGALPYNFEDARYIIQMSLFGERLVQQRAQYHR